MVEIAHRNTLKEVMAVLKLSRTSIWERIKDGRLRAVRDGARVYVTGDELRRYLSVSAMMDVTDLYASGAKPFSAAKS